MCVEYSMLSSLDLPVSIFTLNLLLTILLWGGGHDDDEPCA